MFGKEEGPDAVDLKGLEGFNVVNLRRGFFGV